jgi:hypothetical protein
MAIAYAETEQKAQIGDIIFGNVPNLTPFEMECGTRIYSPVFCHIACEDDDLYNTNALRPIEINEDVSVPLGEHISDFIKYGDDRNVFIPDSNNKAFSSSSEQKRAEDILTLAKVAYSESQFKYFTTEFVSNLHRIKELYDTVDWTSPLLFGNEKNTAEMLWGYIVHLLTSQKILSLDTSGFTGHHTVDFEHDIYDRWVKFGVENVDIAFHFEWAKIDSEVKALSSKVYINGKEGSEFIPGNEWDDPSRRSKDVFLSIMESFRELDAMNQTLEFDLVNLTLPRHRRLLPFINVLKDIPEM